MTRYYCENPNCGIETYNACEDENFCPCCKTIPEITAQEYEAELAHERDIAKAENELHREMYGCPYEDMQSMNYRSQMITNDAGEPIGWG